MKKLFAVFITALLVVAFTVPADAAMRNFKIYVYKAETGEELSDASKATKLTDNVAYAVYQYSSTSRSNTRETLYSDRNQTALTSDPWVTESTFDDTASIEFWCDPTESGDEKVRILVIDVANGFSTWVTATYDETHTVIIDERPNIQHVLTFPVSDSETAIMTANTTTDYGIDMKPGTLIMDAFFDITTAGGSSTSDLGDGGDEDLWIDNLATTSVGLAHDDVFDTAFQYITENPAAAKKSVYYKWGTDSFDGFVNIVFTVVR